LPVKPLTKNPKSSCARGCASDRSQHETETRLNHADVDALADHHDPDADADLARLKALWPRLSATARQTLVALAGQLATPTKTQRKR
jgi:hypothetical protein